ncbi:hypothetical protein CBOM_07668 [Ceraceosorus bombacis]|uniref:Uncharacterized protein n=1 Tax=Ceraceosorus bombacis TaxID=401625 RepID=A0A0P1B8U5_9BASI|nr:hypothetical protein CBOM_07668 [Ceraceosorus bombacis]
MSCMAVDRVWTGCEERRLRASRRSWMCWMRLLRVRIGLCESMPSSQRIHSEEISYPPMHSKRASAGNARREASRARSVSRSVSRREKCDEVCARACPRVTLSFCARVRAPAPAPPPQHAMTSVCFHGDACSFHGCANAPPRHGARGAGGAKSSAAHQWSHLLFYSELREACGRSVVAFRIAG